MIVRHTMVIERAIMLIIAPIVKERGLYSNREWLKGCVNEVNQVKGISGILSAFELAMVVAVYE